MWVDPIVAEVRKHRAEYAAQFGDDFEAIVRDLRDKEEKGGKKVVSFPAREPSSESNAA
jgi:hypothetical protein